MEEDPFAPSQPKMVPPLSNFKPKLQDHDYMELVCENGQILTRSRRSNDYNAGSTQIPRTTSLLDLYETEYDEVLNQNTGDASDKNLGVGDTQVVPVRRTRIRTNGLRAMADHMNQKNSHPEKGTVEFSPPDAQSVAMGRCGEMVGTVNKEKDNSDLLGWSTELCGASLSMCSRGTSEDPICSPQRTYADSEGSTYLSSNLDDVSDDVRAQVPARTRKTAKRKRSANFDDLSERERRHEINKRMRALQKLLPNCNKEDNASLLDEAIKYLRTLQLQIQFHMMSMRNGFVAPPMMLPLAHYSLVDLGLGMRLHTGTPQFPPSPVPGAALPGISDALHTLGFPNQPGLIPMSGSSFFCPTGTSSQQSVPPPSGPVTASPRQFQNSASMSSSDDAVHKCNQITVDRPSEYLQMPEFSQVKNENPEHRDGQARK